MSNIQFVPQTARDFLAGIKGSNGEPLAKAGTRGRFGKEATAALEKARAEGFRFIGDEGHPQTEVKVKREPKQKTVTTPAPAPAQVQTPNSAPAQTTPSAPAAKFVAKDVRAWAKANGHKVGERGRIHPNVIDAFVKAGGKPVGGVAKTVSPLVMPKRRRETTGFTTVGGTLIRQDSCGKCSNRVAQCPCEGGPHAYKFLAREAGTDLRLSLDKPAL